MNIYGFTFTYIGHDDEETIKGFVSAKTFAQAIEKIAEDYGDDRIDQIRIWVREDEVSTITLNDMQDRNFTEERWLK